MDCEKFDEHVIDALYEELDELTAAALKRHTDGCARCSAILAGLKATREGAALALEEPSADLEARIMDAERAAQRTAPWPRKVMRAAAWAGSHAMRPQLAMAALFMLVVGSSLLLLRARPGTVGAPVEVTERGAPSPAATAGSDSMARARAVGRAGGEGTVVSPAEQRLDNDLGEPKQAEKEAAPAAAAPAPAPTATPTLEDAPGAAKDEAADTAALALSRARDARAKSGCPDALLQYEEVSKRFPSTPEAAAANQEARDCQREVAAAPMAKTGAAKPVAMPTKPAGSASEAPSSPPPP